MLGATQKQITYVMMMFLAIFFSAMLKAANVYVDLTALGANDGSSWSNAFTSVRHAVSAANTGDVIIIAEGRYLEGQQILIDKTLSLRGGFPSGGGPQDIDNHPTILDGHFSHRVLFITADTHIEGLRIFNGFVGDNGDGNGGGGILTIAGLTLVQCQIVGNTVQSSFQSQTGGGISASVSAPLAIHHSRISGNMLISEIRAQGGGIYAFDLLLNHSVVHGNRAVSESESQGGGVRAGSGASQSTVIHSRISANQAILLNASNITPPQSGGIFGNTSLVSSVLWGNVVFNGSDSPITNEHEFGSLTSSNSLIRDQNPIGIGNIDATIPGFDPGFLLSDINNGQYNFGLKPNSVLIDAGDDSALPNDVFDLDGDGVINESIPLDLLGAPRIHDAAVDIGPFELDLSQKDHNTAANHYYFDVNSQATLQDGLSWTTAFASLNDWFYLSDRTNITQLSFATGHYPTTGTLKPNQALTILGGLNPLDTKFIPEQYSIIDPGHDARVMEGGLTARGIVIQNGLADIDGGGIKSLGQSVTLIHSRVRDNGVLSTIELRSNAGGGIYAFDDTVTLWSTEVSGNRILAHKNIDPFLTLLAGGGGIKADGNASTVNLYNSRVLNNGIIASTFDSSFNVDVNARGGGVQANGQAINSLIANNRAVAIGGLVDTQGAGWQSSLNLINSILWNNTATENFSTFANEHEAGALNTNHSLIRGQNPAGIGNIDATAVGFDPSFVAAGLGDYRLAFISPLLDVADASALPVDSVDLDDDGDTVEPLPLDISGMQRVAGSGLDIGPHERPVVYWVGGMVTGLLPGNTLTVQNNASDDLLITANGDFSFVTTLTFDEDYAVTILNQPADPIQPCSLNNETGIILNDDIINVIITCDVGNDLIYRNGFE